LKSGSSYVFRFKDLEIGIYSYTISINRPFFVKHNELDVTDGDIKVSVTINKKALEMEVDVAFSGIIEVECDRCLDRFFIPVDYNGSIIVKFADNPPEDKNDEIMYLRYDVNEIDLEHYLYESISLSIPYRKVHPDLDEGISGCNPEMLKRLKDFMPDDID